MHGGDGLFPGAGGRFGGDTALQFIGVLQATARTVGCGASHAGSLLERQFSLKCGPGSRQGCHFAFTFGPHGDHREAIPVECYSFRECLAHICCLKSLTSLKIVQRGEAN